MNSLTLKEIISQVWGKCKSTFPTINDSESSTSTVYSSEKTGELVDEKIKTTLSEIDVAENKTY